MTTLQSGEICGFSRYMGFGLLDVDSVKSTGEGAGATYSMDGDLVYAVERARDNCTITEFCEGKKVRSSSHKELAKAFFHLVAATIPAEHPRFYRLAMETIHSGNVHFVWPDNKTGYLAYPAGFCFTLRQAVMGRNRGAWERLGREIAKNGPGFPVGFVSETPGAIFRLHDDGRTSREDVSLVLLNARLLELTQAVSLCQRIGFILPGKEYRMEVCGLGTMVESTNLYSGAPDSGVRAYSVFEFGPGTGQVPSEGADGVFSRMTESYAMYRRTPARRRRSRVGGSKRIG